MGIDEFEIKAIRVDGTYRIWTRNNLAAAISICTRSVKFMPFVYAIVINTYNGEISDPLFEASQRDLCKETI